MGQRQVTFPPGMQQTERNNEPFRFQTLIDLNVEHGSHCASSAMRSLIRHHCGVSLSEAVVWGAGSALFFLSAEFNEPDMDYFFAFGWTGTLDDNLLSNLGLEGSLRAPNDAEAWTDVRTLVANGTPVLITGDIFYLWYKERIRFPGHRFIVCGFDDERQLAAVLERTHPHPYAVALDDLRQSRHPPPPSVGPPNEYFFLSSGSIDPDPYKAAMRGLMIAAERMLSGFSTDPSHRSFVEAGVLLAGMPGLIKFKDRVVAWRHELRVESQLRKRTLYFAQLIYANGSGGAFFRNTLVSLLIELDAPGVWIALAQRAAAYWNALASALCGISQAAIPRDAHALWQDINDNFTRIIACETELYESLLRHRGCVRAKGRIENCDPSILSHL